MKYLNFCFLMLTETVKYFLISYGIFGMKLKANYKKYLPVLVLFIGIMFVVNAINLDIFYLRLLYNFLILVLFFDEKFAKKIQFYFMEYIAICAIDLLLWSVFATFVDREINNEIKLILNWISEVSSFVLYVMLCILLRRAKEKIHQGIENLSAGYFIMAVILLSILGLMIGMAQGNVLGRMNERVWKYFLTFGGIVLILFIIMIFIFFYIAYSKKQLEREKQFRDKYIVLQKEYYERIVEDDKTIRGFRHDVAKHIQVMNAMCVNDEVDELKEYIASLSGRYMEETTGVRTGNLAADYFINHTIDELKSYGEIKYEVIGRFPGNMCVSNVDISILFGNALENAKEALKKVEGERKVKVSITNYKDRLFLVIANSVSEEGEINLRTTKKDTGYHGYGIKNMRDVVARYGGSIHFKIEDGMFIADIEI